MNAAVRLPTSVRQTDPSFFEPLVLGSGASLVAIKPRDAQSLAESRRRVDDSGAAPFEGVVTPGQEVTTLQSGYMRGHGTHLDGQRVISSVAGVVERINKLVSVRPLKTRYTAEIGDVVVCRVSEVGQKRWRIDVNSRQDAVLLLASINLPGGVQRRKSEADELNMRGYFAEGDLLSAEVQAFFGDGSISIHTRNQKYGKLSSGTFVVVPPSLIKRSKSHFVSLPCGVGVVLGMNGYLWVCAARQCAAFAPTPHGRTSDAMDVDEDEESAALAAAAASDADRPLSIEEREFIARVANCVHILSRRFLYIGDATISAAFTASTQHQTKDLLKPAVMDEVAAHVREVTDLA